MENIVGTRIREEREAARMSQDELAQAIGLSNRSQVHRIETGERRVDSILLRRISEALEVPMDAFFDESRSEALALARQGAARPGGVSRTVKWGLELLSDIKYAEETVRSRGW